MPAVVLNADTLSLLSEGLLGKILNAELAKLIEDLDARGHDGKERTLTVEYRFKCAKGKVACETLVKGKVPSHSPYQTTMNLSLLSEGGPQLLFNPQAMEDPGQGTIDDVLPMDRKSAAAGE